ncbi:unnamed protein product [Lactuca saligna]|uniref:Uncharacterized protein n=1 Tax=Lactuca saligna TaxID=75948 RepID=A0AA35YE17_LACSI|nr:unnamed protein product [Lactuca saligna]
MLTKLFTIEKECDLIKILGFTKRGEDAMETQDDNEEAALVVFYEPNSKHFTGTGINGEHAEEINTLKVLISKTKHPPPIHLFLKPSISYPFPPLYHSLPSNGLVGKKIAHFGYGITISEIKSKTLYFNLFLIYLPSSASL